MIEVLVEVGGAPVDPAAVRVAATRALEARRVADAEVSVTFLDDDAIRALNREHLGHDRPTDVLAFALWEPGDAQVIGDVYVGWEQAVRQAGDEGVDAAEEFTRLVVHGVLHVTGMDHPEDAARRLDSDMYRLQESLVHALAPTEAP